MTDAQNSQASSQAQPFVGTMIATAAVKKIATELVKAGLGAAFQRAAAKSNVPINPSDAAGLAVEVATEMAVDPKMVNTMNAEPLTQSRVAIGASSATLLGTVTAIAIIWDQISRRDFEPTTLGSSLAVVLAAGYSLYGRLAKNLPPLWNRS
jgi:hypothetical protein